MTDLIVERTIAAPADAVFAWLTDPRHLTAAPLALRAGWAGGTAGPGVGAVREVWALGLWAREEIIAWDPPHGYEYRITRAVPAIEHREGAVVLTPVNGGTHVRWISDFTIPLAGGGKPMELLMGRLLPGSFAAILDACSRDLESS
ncbi:MAG: SRPBCC family protein [Gordonia sp. (in: high G+C Gram-positive bacteria)]|uniref:SRPBCC family protein n=1 Tax=Gordonia sp. (in: high G+C Gram-positive bacteria) TaxID=84139 RepID=UPI0039E3338A